MPLKSTAAQLRASHNYYIHNIESIKIRKALYHAANREEVNRKLKEGRTFRKLQKTTIVMN
jgi:ABC-type oligopeptide transport system substrate-binding subunit